MLTPIKQEDYEAFEGGDDYEPLPASGMKNAISKGIKARIQRYQEEE